MRTIFSCNFVLVQDKEMGVAHLRWFSVDDSLLGSGIGRQLLSQAMRFVDEQRFDRLSAKKGGDGTE